MIDIVADFPQPQLLPLADPPRPPAPPRLPARRSRIAFTTTTTTAPSSSSSSSSSSATQPAQQQWIASSHFYPAAWPRSHHRSARSDAFTPNPLRHRPYTPAPADKQQAKQQERTQREQDFAAWKQHVGDHDQANRTIQELIQQADPKHHPARLAQARRDNEQQLWACVQRIVPADLVEPRNPQQQGYTLVVSHANGLHKELWEPALAAIVQRLVDANDGAVRIDEIWSFDATHSGEAFSVNRDALGDVVSWFDHPRDVGQFLDNFLPPPSSSASLVGTQKWYPTLLARCDGKANASGRKILFLGHSFGGTTMAHLALSRPAGSVEGLVLVDPAMPGQDARGSVEPFDLENVMLARGAIARKDAFASATEVRDYCTSKPYFQAWDPRALDLHLRFGIRPLALPLERAVTTDDMEEEARRRQPMTWSNPKWLEADAFAQTWMAFFTLAWLERRGAEGGRRGKRKDGSGPWIAHLSMRKGMAKLAKYIEGIPCLPLEFQHLVVQENPEEIGAVIASTIRSNSHPEDEEKDATALLSTLSRPRL